MEKYINLITANSDIIMFVITVIFLMVRNIKQGKTFKNALIIAVNAMKDETKIKDDKFDFKLTEKAKEINELNMGDAKAYKKFEDLLKDMNNKKGFKVGSYKGKPVYLEEAVGMLAGLVGAFKKKR